MKATIPFYFCVYNSLTYYIFIPTSIVLVITSSKVSIRKSQENDRALHKPCSLLAKGTGRPYESVINILNCGTCGVDKDNEYKLFTIILLVLITILIYILISLITKTFKYSDIKLKY